MPSPSLLTATVASDEPLMKKVAPIDRSKPLGFESVPLVAQIKHKNHESEFSDSIFEEKKYVCFFVCLLFSVSWFVVCVAVFREMFLGFVERVRFWFWVFWFKSKSSSSLCLGFMVHERMIQGFEWVSEKVCEIG